MKLSKNNATLIKLVDLIPLREAEEAGAEEENPFGGADDAEKKDSDKEEKEPAKSEAPAGVMVKFNRSAVKRYNDQPFLGNQGQVASIDKNGVVVKMPNEVEILVNFSDII